MTSAQLYRRLLSYVAPHWRVFALAIAGTVVVAATEPMLPALLKPLLDGTFVERDETLIRWMPLAIVALFVIRGAGEYVAHYGISWVGNRLVMDLRGQMFRRLVSLPSGYYADSAAGNLISKLTFDVTQVTAAGTSVLSVVFKDFLSIVGLLGWMLWLNWKLTLLAFAMAPIIVLVVRLIGRRLRAAARDAQTAMGDLTQVLGEAVEGNREVKLFGGQNYEITRFDAKANQLRRLAMKQAAAAALSVPVVQLVAALALAAIIYLAVGQAGRDAISLGGFISFITAMLMLSAPLKRLTTVNEHLQRGLAAAESIFTLIDEPPEADTGRTQVGRVSGRIEFRNVKFSYASANRPALEDISLDIAPGETIALVGASGGGKTTLASLVPRFYVPESGNILIDGQDIRSLTLESLRANIALVSQDVVLFNDTIAANIAYGVMNQASREQIEGAALAAHALEFIGQMPEGLDTVVGENGVKLSGGQRQRIAIARAVLRDAPILILDEATSALDSESERHVQAALEELMRGRTTIVIAHRLSTIEKATRIVVLERGRIAESGAHAELLVRGGVYSRLYRIQFADQGA